MLVLGAMDLASALMFLGARARVRPHGLRLHEPRGAAWELVCSAAAGCRARAEACSPARHACGVVSVCLEQHTRAALTQQVTRHDIALLS